MGIQSRRPRNGISLCAGGGGLDLGLHLAEPNFACRCFVEWEPDAQAVLVAGMLGNDLPSAFKHGASIDGLGLGDAREKYSAPFAQAAVWPDVRTFIGDEWRGHIDLVSAGYPCQPFSAAGKRAGSDDPRHLWPDVARVLWETGAEWGFFENVSGHITLGLEAVLRDLWEMGWTPAVGLFSSQETGNSHERQRIFIVAHNPSAGRSRLREREKAEHTLTRGRSDYQSKKVANADGGHSSPERQQRGGQFGLQQECGGNGGAPVDDARCAERRTIIAERRDGNRQAAGRLESASGLGEPVEDVADTKCNAGHQGGCGHGSDRAERTAWQANRFSASRPLTSPPSPNDSGAWGHILTMAPDLAPSLAFRDIVSRANDLAAMVAEGRVAETQAQSDLRRMANALAQRPRALRLYGNGVDPLVAGYAWRTLSAAHGLRPLDLAAAN